MMCQAEAAWKKGAKKQMARISRRRVLGLLGAALGTAPALAQPGWPSPDLRLVCPFPPGGTTDVVARLVAAAMRQPLGRTVVVE